MLSAPRQHPAAPWPSFSRMARTALVPVWSGRRRRHVSWSFPWPDQQDLTRGVVEDETGFLTEASRT